MGRLSFSPNPQHLARTGFWTTTIFGKSKGYKSGE